MRGGFGRLPHGIVRRENYGMATLASVLAGSTNDRGMRTVVLRFECREEVTRDNIEIRGPLKPRPLKPPAFLDNLISVVLFG